MVCVLVLMCVLACVMDAHVHVVCPPLCMCLRAVWVHGYPFNLSLSTSLLWGTVSPCVQSLHCLDKLTSRKSHEPPVSALSSTGVTGAHEAIPHLWKGNSDQVLMGMKQALLAMEPSHQTSFRGSGGGLINLSLVSHFTSSSVYRHTTPVHLYRLFHHVAVLLIVAMYLSPSQVNLIQQLYCPVIYIPVWVIEPTNVHRALL